MADGERETLMSRTEGRMARQSHCLTDRAAWVGLMKAYSRLDGFWHRNHAVAVQVVCRWGVESGHPRHRTHQNRHSEETPKGGIGGSELGQDP